MKSRCVQSSTYIVDLIIIFPIFTQVHRSPSMNMDTTKQADPIKTRVSGNEDIESSPVPSTIRGDIRYSDGSVILQAGQTQFRVHKSILEACSSVFKDMFSLSQPEPSDSEVNLDGCPIVHLHDSARDLALLLEAIYRHPNAGLTPTAGVVTIRFEMLSVLLRLGNKYDIPDLRDNALCRIRAEYAPEPHDLSLDHFVYFSGGDALPFETVRLAYEEGVYSVLPVALFHIAVHYDVKQIFAGVERDDGTRATLPHAMIRACLEGREQLILKLVTVPYKWLLENPLTVGGCRNVHVCGNMFRLLKERIFRVPVPDLKFCLDRSWDYIAAEVNATLCIYCLKHAKDCHEEGRKRLWEELPSVFGFGSWEAVKKMDKH